MTSSKLNKRLTFLGIFFSFIPYCLFPAPSSLKTCQSFVIYGRNHCVSRLQGDREDCVNVCSTHADNWIVVEKVR